MNPTRKNFWVSIVHRTGGRIDVVERINEVIFGLIMVLTFTCTMSAATQSREEVGTILWAALGCNVAWGIIDAFIYIFSLMMYRGESLETLHEIHSAKNDDEADEAIKDILPPLIGNLIKKEQLRYLRTEIKRLPEPPKKTIFTFTDVWGAVKIFFLVFLSTFPVVIPFFFINDVHLATRVSNGVALILLFITGVYFGRKTRHKPVLTGFILMGIGAVLVVMTIALGG